MIAILAVLLHNGAIEAADFLCAPAGCKAESCILTQAPTAQQVIHNYGTCGKPAGSKQQKFPVAH